MNMKSILTLLCLLIGYEGVSAQEITKQEKGYFNLTELGYFFAGNRLEAGPAGHRSFRNNAAHALSLRNINGVFLNNNLSVGVGLGLDGYTFNADRYHFDNTFLLFGDAAIT